MFRTGNRLELYMLSYQTGDGMQTEYKDPLLGLKDQTQQSGNPRDRSANFSSSLRITEVKIPNRVQLVRARAFSMMNNEEQRKFVAQRFSRLCVAELVDIVNAIYGRPYDKGRPRVATGGRQSACAPAATPSGSPTSQVANGN
jgi:hypothetical protein